MHLHSDRMEFHRNELNYTEMLNKEMLSVILQYDMTDLLEKRATRPLVQSSSRGLGKNGLVRNT